MCTDAYREALTREFSSTAPSAPTPSAGLRSPGQVLPAASAGHLPDPVVVGIGYEQVARGIHRHAVRVSELGAGGRAAVTAEPLGAGAGHGVDITGGHGLAVEAAGAVRHHPDPLVV